MSGETSEQPRICQCGREVTLLNPASDTPKCVGCGLPAEICTCEITTD